MDTLSKVCFKCGQEKPILDFYVHPKMKDGRLKKCKDCARRDAVLRYWEKRPEILEYDRVRAKLPHRVAERRTYARSARGAVIMQRSKDNWAARNPVAREAHHAVNNAIRDGLLIQKPCEVCGAPKAEAHHDDYTKKLCVRWLCDTHHKEHHVIERANQRARAEAWAQMRTAQSSAGTCVQLMLF